MTNDDLKGRTAEFHMVSGSLWMVGMRYAVRGIGFVSTLILVRLLTPADFGLIAMAMLVVSFLEIFAQAGNQSAIIRHPDPTREHFDTAWTISLITGAGIFAVLMLAAPVAGRYFSDSRASELVYWLAISPLVGGIENIGIVKFRRELEFHKDFRFGVYCKVAQFLVTISFALWLRSYWALAIGIVGGRIVTVALSYAMQDYRPRISLSKFRELWSFSYWILILNFGVFFEGGTDRVVIGGTRNSEQLGYYSVAGEIGTIVPQETVRPASRALFPIYAKLSTDSAELRKKYLAVLTTVAYICSSASVGIALVSHEVVLVLLGEVWLPAAPMIAWLAFGSGIKALSNTALLVFGALGHAKVCAVLTWLRVCVLVPILVVTNLRFDLEAVAIARAAVMLAVAPLAIWWLKRAIGLETRAILGALWRPAVATAVMAVGVSVANPVFSEIPTLRLIESVFVGALLYVATAIALWHASGRPGGPERGVWQWTIERAKY